MQHTVFVGTYSPAEAKGIPVFQFDDATGALTVIPTGGASGIANPSYLALHPNGRWLYAVSEAGGGEVVAFALNAKTHALTPINKQSARSGGPCHVSLDHAGRNVLVANYGGGSVMCFPVDPQTGGVGGATAFVQHGPGSNVNPGRQKGPHGHCIQVAPVTNGGDRFALACDLGLDKVLVYRFDSARGTLTPNDPPAWNAAPGSGPRHFAWHRSGNFAFVIHELNSTLASLRWDGKKGTLTEVNTISTLPAGFTGSNSPAAVHVHPGGRFVYGSNRGADSIAVFHVDEKSGKIETAGVVSIGGKNPRDFTLSPSGRWLLVGQQDSDLIAVFHVDERTGLISPTGQSARVPKPVCLVFA